MFKALIHLYFLHLHVLCDQMCTAAHCLGPETLISYFCKDVLGICLPLGVVSPYSSRCWYSPY
jgi:hypothetical protein